MFFFIFAPLGELAQLVERLHGMQEVTGSNPVFSTITICLTIILRGSSFT